MGGCRVHLWYLRVFGVCDWLIILRCWARKLVSHVMINLENESGIGEEMERCFCFELSR